MRKLEKKEKAGIGIFVGLFALMGMIVFIGLFFAFVESSLTPSIPDGDAPWVVCITTTELNVRTNPSTEAEVIMILDEGTPIMAQLPRRQRIGENWAQIEIPEVGIFWACSCKGDTDYLVVCPS